METQHAIHILKHHRYGDAENALMHIIQKRGHKGTIVDPRAQLSQKGLGAPDVVIARCELDSFSDQAFAAYLAYFQMCDKLNIPVINPREVMLLGQDKFITHTAVDAFISRNSLNYSFTPETVVCYSPNEALMQAEQFFDKWNSVVTKKSQSGRGQGVNHIKSKAELITLLAKNFNSGDPILLQQPIEKELNESGGQRDIRVWAYRDTDTNQSRFYTAYYRNAPAGQFLTNISQGGYISPIPEIESELVAYTECVLDAVSGDIVGIDFCKDRNGKYWFLEVNIAFETGPASLKMCGDGIWEKAVDLAEAKIG